MFALSGFFQAASTTDGRGPREGQFSMKDSTENLGGMYHIHINIVLRACRALQEHRDSFVALPRHFLSLCCFFPEEWRARKLWHRLPELPWQGRGATGVPLCCNCARTSPRAGVMIVL